MPCQWVLVQDTTVEQPEGRCVGLSWLLVVGVVGVVGVRSRSLATLNLHVHDEGDCVIQCFLCIAAGLQLCGIVEPAQTLLLVLRVPLPLARHDWYQTLHFYHQCPLLEL